MHLGIVVSWQSLRAVHEALLEIYPSTDGSVSRRRWCSGKSRVHIFCPGDALCAIGLDLIIVAVPRRTSNHEETALSRWIKEVLSLRLHPAGTMAMADVARDDVVLWVQRAILELARREEIPVLPRLGDPDVDLRSADTLQDRVSEVKRWTQKS